MATKLALVVCCLTRYATTLMVATLVTLSAVAEENTNLENCAKIENGGQRLACYDKSQKRLGSENQELIEVDNIEPAKEGVPTTVLENRYMAEQSLYENSFGILPYRRSYILPLSYLDEVNEEPYSELLMEAPGEELQQYEIKFQYSFKVPIGRRFLLGDDQLYFGFTQLSLWQAYNSDLSSPFRENNYQPELLWAIPLQEPIFNGRLNHIVLGLNHQSNGQAGELSRSWNRVTFDTAWADEDWAVGLRLWYRLKEKSADDDNPDIERYLGYGHIQVGYRWDKYRFTGIFFNNLRRDENHTSVDISFSMPISSKLRGFIQYYDGYGETLIDYNHRNRRIGIGVVLSDWF
ncbi:phospholipase A [Aurantivibrio infirmus]